jgi:hypothetical protein
LKNFFDLLEDKKKKRMNNQTSPQSRVQAPNQANFYQLEQYHKQLSSLAQQSMPPDGLSPCELYIIQAQLSGRLRQPERGAREALLAIQADPLFIEAYPVAAYLFEQFRAWDYALAIYALASKAFCALKRSVSMAKALQPDNTDLQEIIFDDCVGQADVITMDCENTPSLKTDLPKPPEELIYHSPYRLGDGVVDDKGHKFNLDYIYNVLDAPIQPFDIRPAAAAAAVPVELNIPSNINYIYTLNAILLQFLDTHFISTPCRETTIPSHLLAEYSKYSRMTNWLLDNGSTFPKLVIKHFTDTHRGVFSTCPIYDEETICHIPLPLIITSQVARSSPIGSLLTAFKVEVRSKHSYIALFILHELLNTRQYEAQMLRQEQLKSFPNHAQFDEKISLGDHNKSHRSGKPHGNNTPSVLNEQTHQTIKKPSPSFFAPYLDILPTDFDTIPLFFSHDDLSLLAGSFTMMKIHDRCHSLYDEYNQIKTALSQGLIDYFQIFFNFSNPEQPLDVHFVQKDTEAANIVNHAGPVVEKQSFLSAALSLFKFDSLDAQHAASSPNSVDLIDNEFIHSLAHILDLDPNTHKSQHVYLNPVTDSNGGPNRPHTGLEKKLNSQPQTMEQLVQTITDFVNHTIIPFTFKQFVWARMCVITRIFGMTVGTVKTDGLVPFCDMLNHKLPRETRWSYDNNTNGFSIISLQTRTNRGIEIFDSYGKKCNNRFFINYGFTLTENGDNEAVLNVGPDLHGVDKYVTVHYDDNRNHLEGQYDPLSEIKYSIICPHTSADLSKQSFSLENQRLLVLLTEPLLNSVDTLNTITPTGDPIHKSFPMSDSTPSYILDEAVPINQELVRWPHEYAHETYPDRLLFNKLTILGIELSELESLPQTPSPIPQIDPPHTPKASKPPHFAELKIDEVNPPQQSMVDSPSPPLAPKSTPTQSDSTSTSASASTSSSPSTDTQFRDDYQRILNKAQRTYQVPPDPMETKTIQLLSYLRFLHLTPEQIVELRKYQIQNGIIHQTISPASSSIIYSALPLTVSPYQSSSNSSSRKQQYLNLDNIVLITLENEISTLKTLIYITHLALANFQTTLEQDIYLLRQHTLSLSQWTELNSIHDPTLGEMKLKPEPERTPKPSVSNYDLVTFFTALEPPNPTFILSTNQFNSIIQRRGEKIVLRILRDFALETLQFIHQQEQQIESEVAKLSLKLAKKTSKRSKKAPIVATLNQPRPSVRELLARKDSVLGSGGHTEQPLGNASTDNNNNNNSTTTTTDSTHYDNLPPTPASSTGFNTDYKYEHDDESGKAVNESDHDGDDEDGSAEDIVRVFISRRRAEALVAVASTYPKFSAVVGSRIAILSKLGLE